MSTAPAPPLPANFRRIPARQASPEKRARWAQLPPRGRNGTVGDEPLPPEGGSTNTASPPATTGLKDDGSCLDGYETVTRKDGTLACFNKATGCLYGYSPDPADPKRCRFNDAGKPCGPPSADGTQFLYDEDGNCVSPTGEKFGQENCGRPDGSGCPGGKSVFGGDTPAAPAKDEPMPLWQKGALALAALLVLKKLLMPMKGRR